MDVKKINTIIELFKNAQVDELSLELKDFKITLKNNTAHPIPTFTNIIPNIEEVKKEDKAQTLEGEWIKAPFVGTYYAASSADAPAYVQVGQKVNQGDVLFILEAMKVMNEIKAHKSGTILKININNGEMVEFDQELILLGD